MESNRLLFVDTETGGLDPQKHSLLSIGVLVWDKKMGELFSDEYFVYNEEYVVTKTAARINNFDKDVQREKALTPQEIVNRLIDIKHQYFSEYPSIPLAGHNIVFDIEFIKKLFVTCGRSYEKTFSHRLLDTYSIIKYLSDCNLIPQSINSSARAFKYFEIPVLGRHTALGDGRATMLLYSKMLSILKSHIE